MWSDRMRRGWRLLAAPWALASGLAGLTGCGATPTAPAVLPGARVARMAEERLEADHPGIAPGRLRCPDLVDAVGATTRCVRTATLSRGRQVMVLGTIQVMSLADGDDLHVRLDEHALEYGLRGDYLAARLRTQLPELGEERPDGVACPYLTGWVGASVTCTVSFVSGESHVRVTVTGLRPATYDVAYRITPDTLAVG
jgi:hypothetical protein